MTNPVMLEKGMRVRFTPKLGKNYPKGAADKVFIFDSVDERRGSYDHRLMDENGTFVLWANRLELHKMPDRKGGE